MIVVAILLILFIIAISVFIEFNTSFLSGRDFMWPNVVVNAGLILMCIGITSMVLQ